jgi:hypothetical protein
MTEVDARTNGTAHAPAVELSDPRLYLNRELTWLAFN